jgi:hypothetical protein
MPENLAIGTSRISITITRKTEADLIVSQTAIERWFVTEVEASAAMAEIVTALNHVVALPIENDKPEESASPKVEPRPESMSEDLKIEKRQGYGAGIPQKP